MKYHKNTFSKKLIMPKLAVIVPNLNSPVIDEVVTSVLSQSDETLEVWVVGQDCYGKIPTSPRVHSIITRDHILPGMARNIGAQHALADAYIFLDADCIPQPGWLSALLTAWTTHPDAGAISGAMLPESDSFFKNCRQIANFHEYLAISRPGERMYLASFSLLVPRQAWLQSGGFNPNLRHAEDIDFTLRLRAMGLKLFFEPKSIVYHRPKNLNFNEFWDYAYLSGACSIQVRLRHTEISMPFWANSAWTWRTLAPVIAAIRTCQIYSQNPALIRYFYAIPFVFLHKLAWCYGAADGVSKMHKTRL
ncbi:MAG: hypothetical protein APU95_00755 [Hadesarchaea archaeon YNP_N21]|nr:MAG: hypothetical protein APU95_00755 [Hadesarchaea archaeon YNP_N21]